MTSPIGILRSLRRKIGRVVYLTRHSQEDIEALYGPNPNNITPEERMRSMGPGGGPGYGGATGSAGFGG